MHESLERCESKMTKTLANLDQELGAIRAGRANPHVLDHILVDYYGAPTPIQQTANVSVPEPRVIQIAPWDKSMVSEINRALQTSDLGINPTVDGNNIRRDGNDIIKKLKGTDFSEDTISDMLDDLQKMTDDFSKKVDEAVDVKSKEVMTV